MALGHSLFRQEAVEFQRVQRAFGEVALVQPVSTRLLAWLLTAVVGLGLAFLATAQFSRKQTASGYLAPAAGTMKVFPKREGVVTEIYVKQGQEVKPDQPLLAVATSEIAADGENVGTAKLAALRQEKQRLTDQIADEQRYGAAEKERLSAQITNIQSEISDITAQITIQSQRVELAQSLVSAAHQLLTNGYMSVVESKRREDALLEHQQTLASLRKQLTEQQNNLVQARHSLKSLPIETARKLQPLRDQISEIDQRAAEAKGRASYVLRSPAAGRVSMLQASVGAAVQPQQLQLEIIPSASPLQAEVLIPTRAAGFVHVGQEVRLLYDAFPYQNYGTYTGRITQLSHTVLNGPDLTGPVAPKEPVYKAIVALDRPDVDAHGNKVALQSGMLLKAEIILDRRSLAAWLVDPLLRQRM